MKKINSIIAIVTLSIAFSTTASAQVSDVAAASATIVTPISILQTTDMAFGNVAVSSTAGTVVLTSAGVASATDGVTLPGSATLLPAAAEFTVEGQENYTYSITLPSDTDVVLVNTTGTLAEEMTVTDFKSTTANSTAIDNTGVLTGSTDTVFVGATLNVAAGQVAGDYTTGDTPFTVTVNYN